MSEYFTEGDARELKVLSKLIAADAVAGRPLQAEWAEEWRALEAKYVAWLTGCQASLDTETRNAEGVR